MREELLEPLLRKWRIARVLPVLKKFSACELLDVGCGWEARFLQDAAPYIARGVGIDFKAPDITTEKITTISAKLIDAMPFTDNSFDIVTMLAVLEHIEQPHSMLKEVYRVLRPSGIFVGTVPSKAAKPVLEFLAYRLGIINAIEMRDHHHYYCKNSLIAILKSNGFCDIEHTYFQLWMNNYFIAYKKQ